MSRHENDEFVTPIDKSCCLCHNGQKSGTWELCDSCRDALKEKAKLHEAAATVLMCIVCRNPRPSYLPAGFHCARCRARFVKLSTPKR